MPWKVTVKPAKFENVEDGFVAFLGWLKEHNLTPETTVVCMEATGVYSEGLAYFLYASGYTVAVEPPLNIQRKFPVNASKTDELDCQYIAEYACRYADKLALWKPRAEILEQVKLLLTTRQHFTVQLTGHKNALHAANRKKVSSALAKQVHQTMIEQIAKHIKSIDLEIRRLIESDPTFKQTLLLLLSVPGIGLQLAAHLLIVMQETLDPRVLAAFIGICPIKHQSGTSSELATDFQALWTSDLAKIALFGCLFGSDAFQAVPAILFSESRRRQAQETGLEQHSKQNPQDRLCCCYFSKTVHSKLCLCQSSRFSKNLDTLIVFRVTWSLIFLIHY